MSKELSRESVLALKTTAVSALDALISDYIDTDLPEGLKKASLISYWIKDFSRFIRVENDFEPTKLLSYKRGNVVKVNFGFNIGNEYGGLHYAIVLDNKNDHNSGVLTVVPLTSAKKGGKIHRNSVFLGDGIYRSLKLKHDAVTKSLKAEESDTLAQIESLRQLISSAKNLNKSLDPVSEDGQNTLLHEMLGNLAVLTAFTDELEHKVENNQKQQDYLSKIEREIRGMKKGSIALVNQVTSVSKMRIYDPLSVNGVLSGISLPAESMQKLNDKVRELYVFE